MIISGIYHHNVWYLEYTMLLVLFLPTPKRYKPLLNINNMEWNCADFYKKWICFGPFCSQTGDNVHNGHKYLKLHTVFWVKLDQIRELGRWFVYCPLKNLILELCARWTSQWTTISTIRIHCLGLRKIGNIDLDLVRQYVLHFSCILRKKLHQIVVVQRTDNT